MSKRRERTSKNKRRKLTPEEIKTAAARMMASAQAHQRASVWCMDKPDAKPPNIDFFFFSAVSFELILLSVEQSLRLLLLLHFSIRRSGQSAHNLFDLYQTILDESKGKEEIHNHIIQEINTLGQTQNISQISQDELVACLEKHNSSYSDTRYFQLNNDGRLSEKWGFSQRDVQILRCLALALISLNMKEMGRRNIGALLSMSLVPKSKIPSEVALALNLNLE